MLQTAGILVLIALFAPAATTFDPAADVSFQTNPNKVWEYGYSATNSLDLGEFRVGKYADPTGPVGFWHPDVSKGPGPGWYPYIAFNSTKHTQMGSSNGWAVRAGEVAMEAGNSGQYSLFVLRRLWQAHTR